MKYKTTASSWIFLALVLACVIVTCESAGSRREKRTKNQKIYPDQQPEEVVDVNVDDNERQVDPLGASRNGRSIAKALRYIFGGPPPAPDSRMLRRRYKPSGKALKYKSKSFKFGDDGSIIRKKGKGHKHKGSKSKKHKGKGKGKKGKSKSKSMDDAFASFDDGTAGKSYSSYYRQDNQQQIMGEDEQAVESAGFQGLVQLQNLQAASVQQQQQQQQGQQNSQIIDAMDPLIHTLQHNQAVQALMRQQHQQLGGQQQQQQQQVMGQSEEEKVVTEIVQHQYGAPGALSQSGGYSMAAAPAATLANMNLFAVQQPQQQPQQQQIFQNQMNPPPQQQQQQQQQHQPMAGNFHYSQDTGFVMFAAPPSPPTTSPPTPIVQLSTDNTVNLGGLNFAAVMDPSDMNGGGAAVVDGYGSQKINPPNWSDPNLNVNEPAVVAQQPQQQSFPPPPPMFPKVNDNAANLMDEANNVNLGGFNFAGVQMDQMSLGGNNFNDQNVNSPQLNMANQNNVNLNFKNAGHVTVASQSYPTSAPPFTDAIPDTLDSLSFVQPQNGQSGQLNNFVNSFGQQQQESTGAPQYSVASTAAPPSFYTTSAVMSSTGSEETEASSLNDFAQQQQQHQQILQSGPTPSPQMPSRPPVYSIREFGSATPSPPPLKNLMLNFSAFETPGLGSSEITGQNSQMGTFQFSTPSSLLSRPFFSGPSSTTTASPPIQMIDSVVRATHRPPVIASSGYSDFGAQLKLQQQQQQQQNQQKQVLPPTYSQMTVQQLQQLQREQEDASNELDGPFPTEGGDEKESEEEEGDDMPQSSLQNSNADKKPYDPTMTRVAAVKTELNINYLAVQNGNYPATNIQQQITPAAPPAPAPAPVATLNQQMRTNAISKYLNQYTPLVQIRNDPVTPPTPINSGSRGGQRVQSQNQMIMGSRVQQQQQQPEQKIELIDLRGQTGLSQEDEDFEIIDSRGQPLGREEQMALHSQLIRIRGQTPAAAPALQEPQQSQQVFSRNQVLPSAAVGGQTAIGGGHRLASMGQQSQRPSTSSVNSRNLAQKLIQQHNQLVFSRADTSLEQQEQPIFSRGQTTGLDAQRRQYTLPIRGQLLDQSAQQQDQVVFSRIQQQLQQQQQQQVNQFQRQQSSQQVATDSRGQLAGHQRQQIQPAPSPRYKAPVTQRPKQQQLLETVESQLIFSREYVPSVAQQQQMQKQQYEPIYSRPQAVTQQQQIQPVYSKTRQQQALTQQLASQTQQLFVTRGQQQLQPQQQQSQNAYSRIQVTPAIQQQQQYSQPQKIVDTWSFKDTIEGLGDGSSSIEVNSNAGYLVSSPAYSQAPSRPVTTNVNLNNSPRYRAGAKTDYSVESLRTVLGSLYPSPAPPAAARAAAAAAAVRSKYTPSGSIQISNYSPSSQTTVEYSAPMNPIQNSYASQQQPIQQQQQPIRQQPTRQEPIQQQQQQRSSSTIRMPLEQERTIIYNHYHNYAAPPAPQNLYGGESRQNYQTSVSYAPVPPTAPPPAPAPAPVYTPQSNKIPPYNPYINYSPVSVPSSVASSSSEISDPRQIQRFEDPALVDQDNFPAINFEQTNYLMEAQEEPYDNNNLRRSFNYQPNHSYQNSNMMKSNNRNYYGGGSQNLNYNSMEILQQQQPQRSQSTYSVPSAMMSSSSRLSQHNYPTKQNNFNHGNVQNNEDAYRVHSVFTY